MGYSRDVLKDSGNVITTSDLTRYYGPIRGIDGVNLNVRQGEVFGFLGPNGAGKTTTIRILLDMIRPTSGSAQVFGLDVRRDSVQIRRRLGNLPGDVALYDTLRGMEVLKLLGSFRGPAGTRRVPELAERLSLDLSRTVRAYSHGMKQKLAIIQAFMHDPELLILDEPTLGLDPLMQHEFYSLVMEEKARGKTVFLSSHILPEVERVCDRVGIIREGRLVAVEEVESLKRKKLRKMDLVLKEEPSEAMLRLPGAQLVRRDGMRLEYLVSGEVAALLKEVAKLPVQDIVFPEPTLEEAFLEFYQPHAVESLV
ncbi:MAG: ABC transporter ATP-binding protein [Dehalococcoidia bacterium]|nr:ABC transporter ATP-binding protein [Dehalococcoidia bacterium]